MTTTTHSDKPKPRVFISYSRKDGEDFAIDLRQRLEAENLPLWQDRARMEGGVGWWKQTASWLNPSRCYERTDSVSHPRTASRPARR